MALRTACSGWVWSALALSALGGPRSLFAEEPAEAALAEPATLPAAADEMKVTEAPVVAEPVAEAAATETPVAEAPEAESPVAEVPVADPPVAMAPVTAAPVAETTVTEAPAAQPAAGPPAGPAPFAPWLLSAVELTGAGVRMPGARIGTITDVILDLEGGRSFAVVELAGASGVEQMVVPVTSLRNLAEAKSRTPAAPEGERPADVDAKLRGPAGAPAKAAETDVDRNVLPARGALLSRLIGLRVETHSGVDLGDLEQVVLDMHEGRPVYALVGLVEGDTAAVPWSVLQIEAGRFAKIEAALDGLDASSVNSINDLKDLGAARRLHEQFNREPYWELFGYTPKPDGMEAWQAGSAYCRLFDPEGVITFAGTVLSVGVFHPGPGAAEGVRLRIATGDGGVLIVHLAPRSYLEQNGLVLRRGDSVRVTGAGAIVAGREVLLASEISKGSATLSLRDAAGRPLWGAPSPK